MNAIFGIVFVICCVAIGIMYWQKIKEVNLLESMLPDDIGERTSIITVYTGKNEKDAVEVVKGLQESAIDLQGGRFTEISLPFGARYLHDSGIEIIQVKTDGLPDKAVPDYKSATIFIDLSISPRKLATIVYNSRAADIYCFDKDCAEDEYIKLV